MSMMDKFLTAMKLNGEDDYYDSDEEAYYDENGADQVHKAPVGKDDPSIEIPEDKLKKTPIKQMPATRTRKSMTTAGMEVCVIKPTTVEDAREITETLLANRTVVLNLEGLDVEIAQRIIDFTSGSCFAIRGNLQKISKYIFIITPASVDISGDFQDILNGTFDDNVGQHDGPQQIG
ncbi:MAG: cell division protein SepF [Butyrivibrio sp.]|jgi:cell division inhibitor SepF|nr:cell division protein SepF [Butyrivibrio sp.]